MEYTSKMLISFLDELVEFDRKCRVAINDVSVAVQNRSNCETSVWEKTRMKMNQQSKDYKAENKIVFIDLKEKIEKKISTELRNNNSILKRIQKCEELITLISCTEECIVNKEEYSLNKNKELKSQQLGLTIDELISGKINFCGLAHELNELWQNNRRKEFVYKCSEFYSICRVAERMLKQEIETLRAGLIQNKESLYTEYKKYTIESNEKSLADWKVFISHLKNSSSQFAKQKQLEVEKTKNVKKTSLDVKKHRLEEYVNAFCKKFPPQELVDEYDRIYALEPSYDNYECCTKMEKSIRIGTLKYDVSFLSLGDYTKSFLEKYYYFLYRNNEICIPFSTSFTSEFKYIFKFNNNNRSRAVNSACDLGMRLFMMLPPGKLNFTFIDPVTLGESFAMFTRLVDVDNRTSEVINGKIWFAPADIEQKLKIMTDHISNVTQRCLQGKYDNIYEYNRVAEQNAEAYQVLMLMDFPAGLTDQSLKLLEQIVTSGPKCGVFTVIYRNESQYKKISERSHPLITNIETNFQIFNFDDNNIQIVCSGEKVKDKALFWSNIQLPNNNQMNHIISTLKKGIKNADKVVIGIDKVSNAESTNTTKDGIRIPIGIRGANETQYLTLGVGGSHHALIAGVAGSGKSSLLHTIILQALTQYGPDELRIYLVDFKRGVEFKIYADYQIPSFEVVAIESEREFGYNILKALEDEQKIRADKFKRVKDRKIDRIEDYRNLGSEYKMPRILVIMDEFHELFSNTNDKIGRESSEMMERIVRQGRAFGVHIILSSQSYSNVGGLDKSVYDQMAVRIVLKCSKIDANMLLGDGSSDIDQISIDDPGRAIYNSEAGNKEYNSHFRVAYIDPSEHRSILEKVSELTSKLSDNETRILLSNIEDNKYSIFNQFSQYPADSCDVPGRLHIGEVMSVDNNLRMELTRTDYSNMLMVGSDSDKARSMFAFAILSLAINYWVSHNKTAPAEPFIYLLNYKPFRHKYFIDAPALLAENMLTQYVKNIPVNNVSEVKNIIEELYEFSTSTDYGDNRVSKYLMVFGYQRAEDLKSEEKVTEQQDILSILSTNPKSPNLSTKEMIETILTKGSKKGVHAIFWQDDFKALDIANRKIMTYFYQKVAFDLSKEDFSQFVGINDVSQFGENTAVYSNRIDDIQSFRPYQSPDRTWMEGICEQLNNSNVLH